MAKPKKNNKQTSSSPSVKVQDLQPEKNPKGGQKIEFKYQPFSKIIK